MEAAWEYYHGLLGDMEVYTNYEGWGKPDVYHEKFYRAVAALDSGHRYVLKDVKVSDETSEVLICTL
jgi:hypothetical protein